MHTHRIVSALSALLLLAAVAGAQELGPLETGGPGAAVDHSTTCARCHSNAPAARAMRDEAGRGIAPFDLWRGTMMASSARDPFWRAAVSAEVAASPAHGDEIERTCLSCHAPMAHRVGLDDHGTGSAMHVLDCDSRLGELARDGVSCTICHGIAPDGLGTEASFGAGFVLDPERRLFGPHEAPFSMPMRHHTDFTPARGEHVLRSALCGSCHTLETEVFGAHGEPTGARFLEQAPYLEWRASAYCDEEGRRGSRPASCQSCHVPTTDADGGPLATRIARNPGGRDFPPVRERSPYGRHTFVGGNALVLGILAEHAEELGLPAPPEAYAAAREATHELLATRTARLELQDLERRGTALAFAVRVENLAGHKLPTGHPSRRAWLRVVVRDGRGRVLFASGATDGAGRIVGADGTPLASELAGGPVEPHRDVVRAPGEVALFEAAMADVEGRPTHRLLRAARWWKDDRLLPAGWSASAPDGPRTAPVGVEGDASFGPGGDRVRYELEGLPDGPLEVEVALLHQSISARWAAELFRHATPEVEAFRALYEGADRTPEVLASASAGWR